jgi:hypothetical protein
LHIFNERTFAQESEATLLEEAMTVHHPPVEESAKTILEHVFCFGTAAVGLTACAVALKWILQYVAS